MLLNIDQITIDPNLNPRREGLDFAIIAEYAEAMENGDIFPPIDVFSNGSSDYLLVDGFHRIEAVKYIEKTEIDATIHEGNWRDAKLFSFGVNAEHGKRRTNEDKRRIVMEMLNDEEWGEWADIEIARRCKVSQPFVSGLRKDFLTYNIISENDTYNIISMENETFTGDIPSEKIIEDDSSLAKKASETERTYRTKHGTVSTMNVENIGKSKTKKEPKFNLPPRTEEQKEQDRITLRKSISRHLRLAVILRIMEKVPDDVIRYVYRDLSRQYHPDKQKGVDEDIAKLRQEAFSFISDVKHVWEIDSNEALGHFGRIKGYLEPDSQV